MTWRGGTSIDGGQVGGKEIEGSERELERREHTMGIRGGG